MRKIKGLLLILFSLLIFTGCTATANINVNYDGKITETIDVVSSNSKIQYGDKSVEESIELFLKKYDTALKVGKYNTVINTGKDNSGVTISRSYDNICSFVNGTIFSQYVYQRFECVENDDYYEIKSVGSFIKRSDRYDTWLAPEDINIKISLPVAAEENNADNVTDNTYTWEYDENITDKDFYLKISKTALKKSEDEYNKNIERKKLVNLTLIIFGMVVGLIILGVIIFTLYKKYKKNKLDY